MDSIEMMNRDRAVDAWLMAIAADGWHKANAGRAGELAGAEPRTLLETVGDQLDALAAYHDRIASEAALGAAEGAGTVRERLFDGLMRGFDALQAQRPAVLNIWNSRDPGALLLIGTRSRLHVRRLAMAAGIDTGGTRGQLRLAALSVLVLQTFRGWLPDDSADMAATMAGLDRLLERAERAEQEGLSPDLLGLPGLGLPGLASFLDRLKLPGLRASADPAPPPSPDPPAG